MSVGEWWGKHHKISGVTDQDKIEFNAQAEINRLRRQENRPVNTSTAALIDPNFVTNTASDNRPDNIAGRISRNR